MVELQQIKDFFLWCLLINSGIYLFTAAAVITFRGLIQRTHQKMFGLEAQDVSKAVYRYLATYKLLITVFNFTPWLALILIS